MTESNRCDMTHGYDERDVVGVRESNAEGELTFLLSTEAINAQTLRHMDVSHKHIWGFI